MGAQTSSAIVNSINERVTEISTKSVSNCTAMTRQAQDQTQVIGGIFSSGATMEAVQRTTINMSCVQKTGVIAKLQSEIANAVITESAAAGVALLPVVGNNTSESVANLTNMIKTTVNTENIMKTYSKIEQEQRQKQTNVALFQFGTTMRAMQGAEIFAQAVVDALAQSDVMAIVQNQADLKSSSILENPLNFIGSTISKLFSGLGAMWTGILGSPGTIIFFIAIIFLIGALLKSGFFRKIGEGLGRALGLSTKEGQKVAVKEGVESTLKQNGEQTDVKQNDVKQTVVKPTTG